MPSVCSHPNSTQYISRLLQHVFEYFTERTPRSHLELRETSLVWNYKYAGKELLIFLLPNLPLHTHSLIYICIFLSMISDVEFGRLQARDMLQHLWTSPISNSSVDIVQGSRSVEVRAAGVTKVAYTASTFQ